MADLAWIALSLVPHVGGATLRALVEHFGSAEAVLLAHPAALRAVRGVGPKIAAAIGDVRLEVVALDVVRWRAAGVRAVGLFDDDFPPWLRRLPDPPATLFVLGAWPPPSARRVAMVGTRHPSAGLPAQICDMAHALAARGCTVVSGLAAGVDGAAHTGALMHPAGRTLAVLGGGVLNVYPPEHTALAAQVTARGALLCEVSPEGVVSRPALVARNRLIAALCDALIVAESADDGGAMHAARRAHALNIPVYTLDLPASGNQLLLRDGLARPISPDQPELLLE